MNRLPRSERTRLANRFRLKHVFSLRLELGKKTVALQLHDCDGLWKLPHMRHLLGGVSRDVYFAPNMAWNVAGIYAALPHGSTQAVLLYGSSRFLQDEAFPCDLSLRSAMPPLFPVLKL